MASKNNFFPEKKEINPTIYAYTENNPQMDGLIKVGYTERTVEKRMKDHYPTKGPKGIQRYDIILEMHAMRSDGTFFKDYDVHRMLKNQNIENVGGEWFRCSKENVVQAIESVRDRSIPDFGRIHDFQMRPEQNDAVEITSKYFKSYSSSENRTPHFLWNAKMRFGKTFTAYKLAQKMNWKKVLILTFKPAVENSWKEDLQEHKDFKGWQFISKKSNKYEDINKDKKFVCFGSFQDYLGKNSAGGIKPINDWAHKIKWDCIILDEYHYGAWNENAKKLLSKDDEYLHQISEESEILSEQGMKDSQKIWDEELSPLKTKHYLYLSGTPFRAIESGEFIEEQIFNWTYSDEQEQKEKWRNKKNNPYAAMPRMVMMTYQLPESITQITDTGEYDEFDLNEFFKAEGEKDKAEFKHHNDVQKWLDLIRGEGIENMYDSLKSGKDKYFLPFEEEKIRRLLNHTLWFLPSVASCYAMAKLLDQRSNSWYKDYDVIVCAGAEAGIGKDAIIPVKEKMRQPLNSKTITLTCGKLTTGVTVKPWSGLFMLRNTSAPETYFQTAFRVQSPWTIEKESKPTDKSISEHEILKRECYVFDFAPNRALKLLSEYSVRLNVGAASHEEKVEEFIKYLPVLCFDGGSMKLFSADDILSFAMVGTSGSQLAKKFESARLVNIDDMTLKKLLNNKDALNALMKIPAFRNINKDITQIIAKSGKIKDIQKGEGKLTSGERKELTKEQKERNSLRKDVQKKLQKFATRIPIFMYLTDFREETLKDVIQKLESQLFKKVTSLDVKDFDELITLGLFNSTLMNSAIFAFKRYEHSSLHYSGYTKHDSLRKIGLFDTTISGGDIF